MSRPSSRNSQHSPHEDVYVRPSPLYDPANYPGSNEGLSVEIPVSVATTDPSGQLIPAIFYASFPVEIPHDPIQAHLDQQEFPATSIRKFPSLPVLTSANNGSARATPAPRDDLAPEKEEWATSVRPQTPLRRSRSAVGLRRYTSSPPPSATPSGSSTSVSRGSAQASLRKSITMPAFIDDPVTQSRTSIPAHFQPAPRPEGTTDGKAEGLAHKVVYKAIARDRLKLPSHQEIYDTALHLRTPELDALRKELGIDVGNMPALPPRSDPRQRAWARPLVAQFEEIICKEMRSLWLKERELALRTLANAGVDIVPVVQTATQKELQPAMQLIIQPPEEVEEPEEEAPVGKMSPPQQTTTPSRSASRRIHFDC